MNASVMAAAACAAALLSFLGAAVSLKGAESVTVRVKSQDRLLNCDSRMVCTASPLAAVSTKRK